MRVGLIAALLLLALSSCTRPKAPDYLGFDKIEIRPRSLQEIDLNTSIRFYNPNKYSLRLKSAEGDVFLNGKFVSRSTLDTMIVIPAADTFAVPVSIRMNGKEVINSALPALATGEILLKLDGTVRVGRNGIYRSFPFTYEGKQKIDRVNF